MFELKYLKNVSTLHLDAARCNGCRMCTIVCPHAVFAMENKARTVISRAASLVFIEHSLSSRRRYPLLCIYICIYTVIYLNGNNP